MIKRYLTAAVLIPVMVYLLEYRSPIYFNVFVFAAMIAALIEYAGIMKKKSGTVDFLPLITAGAFSAGIITFGGGPHVIVSGVAWFLPLLIVSFWALFSRREPEKKMITIAHNFFPSVFICVTVGHICLLRKLGLGGDLLNRAIDYQEFSRDILFYLFAVVWLADTAAYHIGKTYGKHKLAPVLSPKKTVEGFFAGIAGGIIVSFAFSWWLGMEIAMIHRLILGIALPLFGLFGDLTESVFKRGVKIKDSSSLIPGHGGMFDRLDSAYFTAPFLYYYCRLILNV